MGKIMHFTVVLVFLGFLIFGCAPVGYYAPGGAPPPPNYQKSPPPPPLTQPQYEPEYEKRQVTVTGDQRRVRVVSELIDAYLNNVEITTRVDNSLGSYVLVQGPGGREKIQFSNTLINKLEAMAANPAGSASVKDVCPFQAKQLNKAIGPSKPRQKAPQYERQSVPPPPRHFEERVIESPRCPPGFDVVCIDDHKMRRYPGLPISLVCNGRAQVLIFNGVADPYLLRMAKQRASCLAEIACQYPRGEHLYFLHTPQEPQGPLP
jgi:hypothetical protein